MHITLIEPFFAGSHQQWAEGLQKNSSHEIKILSLPGRHWKWRMFGGAVSLAKEFKAKIKKTDLILASDMLDLSTFLGLVRKETEGVATALYFHENQLTYPWSPTDQDTENGRKNEYAFMNYTSALAADKIYFNSQYHLQSFLGELPSFLNQFPDHKENQNIEFIRQKSEVLYLGMDLSKYDLIISKKKKKDIPILLWNHRWEYDKNPEDFFSILFELKEEGFLFELIILGEKYKRYPKIFDEAKIKLGKEIIHFGFAKTFEEYAQWLKIADILLVTSHQDFFGGSIIEAMYCNVIPLLPNRLSYPEHIPNSLQELLIYYSKNDLKNKLIQLLNQEAIINKIELKNHIQKYNWKNIIDQYDQSFKSV